ncbi:hypothetical protein A33Q_0380 [Indibacter alkaliphilus LW1]|uniref:Uncharacterized protein n=1 Tax=Indibacter alkaliphilus (strain CCUG 57479 / KCTC 22604 / LW1) TaxID=1189612 RepID=S2DKS4_INDAL|nr:hypothetical protein A33Q_0380 [Indibacter alkaliphilus LW1]
MVNSLQRNAIEIYLNLISAKPYFIFFQSYFNIGFLQLL